MVAEPSTPEHNKFRPHQEEANDIGQFLEWLQEQGVHLMEYGDVAVDHPCTYQYDDKGFFCCFDGQIYQTNFLHEEKRTHIGVCPRCNGEGWWQSTKQDYKPYGKTIQEIIALYFGIDKKAFDAETEAVFKVVQELANASRPR